MSIDWKGLVEFALARLSERSTWTGMIAIATAAGMAIAPDLAEQVATAGAAIAGVVLLLTKDKPQVTVQPVLVVETSTAPTVDRANG